MCERNAKIFPTRPSAYQPKAADVSVQVCASTCSGQSFFPTGQAPHPRAPQHTGMRWILPEKYGSEMLCFAFFTVSGLPYRLNLLSTMLVKALRQLARRPPLRRWSASFSLRRSVLLLLDSFLITAKKTTDSYSYLCLFLLAYAYKMSACSVMRVL